MKMFKRALSVITIVGFISLWIISFFADWGSWQVDASFGVPFILLCMGAVLSIFTLVEVN